MERQRRSSRQPDGERRLRDPLPQDAVRNDLRALLFDIAEVLADGEEPPLLLDAVRHAWVLAALASETDSAAAQVLRILGRELRGDPASLDRSGLAGQLARAAREL